jgi:hypothetical protein
MRTAERAGAATNHSKSPTFLHGGSRKTMSAESKIIGAK